MAHFLLHLLVLTFATTLLALPSLSTLNINWAHGPLSSNLGTIDAGARVEIVWNVSGDPSDLTLSVLLKRNTTQSSVVAAIIAAQGVPNNGSFFWDVRNTIQHGGGYYIRLQTGKSSDWGNGTNNSPPTRNGVYGLAGHFSITPPSTTTSRSTATTTSHPANISTTRARPTTATTTARVVSRSTTRRSTTTPSNSRVIASSAPSRTTTPITTTSSTHVGPHTSTPPVLVTSPSSRTVTTSSPNTPTPSRPPGSNPTPSHSKPPVPAPSAPITHPAGSVGTPTSGNPPSTGFGGNPGSISSQTAPSTQPSSTTSSSSTFSTTVPSPILSGLSIGWGVPTLNNRLGSIITGTNVNIVWDSSQNTANLPMSILLKQGSTSEGGRVVSLPASKNVPNNGLFVWHVDNSLPPGNDYYIRLQTGTSDDWDGGLNTSMPTPGAIYGLAGFFTLNSTSNAAAYATVITTHFVTCCTGGSSNARKSGIIAGSVLGGIIALGFLAILGWRVTKKTPPVAGANPAQNRKFSFSIPPPILAMAATRAREGFDPAQLTFILKPIGFTKIKQIAWQVFAIDGRKSSFSATLPPDRGFGDANIEEDHNAIAGITYARVNVGSQFVPSGWMTVVDYDSEGDQLSFKEPSDFSKKRPHHIGINNRSEVPCSFILGSYHMNIEEGEELQPFQPFGVIEDVKEKLVVPHALYFQVYLTYNVRVGQVMTDDLLDTPLLRPAGGVKVVDFEPGTTINWTVRDESGNLSLERA